MENLLYAATLFSLALAGVGLLALLLTVILLPQNFFCRMEATGNNPRTRRSLCRILMSVLKNGFGAVLVVLGCLLLVLPGQGLLTLLMGLLLVDVPGKHRLYTAALQRINIEPAIHLMNRLRRVCRQPPLQLPND